MSSRTWEGHAELREALKGLACAKGTSSTRVKAVSNAAFKYIKDYKRVVHDIEMFLWKADVEHRLAGLYVVDAIIRQSQLKYGAKDQFTKRFALHLTNTITAIKGIPSDAQQQVRHIVHEWQARGFYSTREIEDAGGKRYAVSSSSSAAQKPQDTPQKDDTTPKAAASSGKLASLLSIIKKQKERNDQQQQQMQTHVDSTTGPLLPQPQSQPQAQVHEPPSLLGSPPRSARIVAQPSHAPLLGSPPQRGGGVLATPRPQHMHQQHHLPVQQQQQQQRLPTTMDADFQRLRAYELDERKRGVSDALLPDPPAARIAQPQQQQQQQQRDNDWNDARSAKKPRSSRWGPPKPAAVIGSGDLQRPPSISTTTAPAVLTRPDERHAPALYSPQRAHSGWQQQQQPPPDTMRPLSPRARGSGFGGSEREREPFHDAKRFAPAPSHAFGPPSSGRYDTNSSSGAPNDRIPGSSGELCRNFVFGRCTYGDQCWHRHDEHEASNVRQHPEVLEMRRKTMLCMNYPRGICRYGDRCSFAHSEAELERAKQEMQSDADSSSAPIASGPRQQGQSMSATTTPLMTAPSGQLSRPNGTGPPPPHPVRYNEVHGDRGLSGAHSMSPHHHEAAAPAPMTASRSLAYQQHLPSASSELHHVNHHHDHRTEAPLRHVGAAGAPPTSSSFAPLHPPHVGAPGLQQQQQPQQQQPPSLGIFPPRGFADMPPPRPLPLGMMGMPPRPPPPGMMGPPPQAMMGPPPPRPAMSYPLQMAPQPQPPQSSLQTPARPPAAPMAVETRSGVTSVDPVAPATGPAAVNKDDDDDDDESAAPEFTLQYDDED